MVLDPHRQEVKIDWTAIKDRLNSVSQAMDDAEQLTPQQAAATMDARARRLAEVPETKLEDQQVLEVVQFSISGQRCAIETRFIHEVIREETVTPIPAVGNCFAGVTNLRGQIVLVVHLEPLLGLEITTKSHVQLLVLGEQRTELAIIVDDIDQVLRLRREQVLELSGGTGSLREIACGCTADARVILDGRALLQCEDFSIEENE
ncbi:chemotaxis protein CheW [Roseimaritima ulvae]|uniref:Chemotaxis protein CheW n=1 Tax=Roseimaritima ulvae TaxID=980254 RepID=A0A5B9QM06_9BACT|nr:chemotaxis protein CheW [Roseimaritima ulvae]QEG39984.1 Chemotaxis protein CheW [Roseimaritima ulvae]